MRESTTISASIHRGIHRASNRPDGRALSTAGREQNDHVLWPLMALVATSDLTPIFSEGQGDGPDAKIGGVG